MTKHSYGYCPECGAPGIGRYISDSNNSTDMCKNGHIYSSDKAWLRPRQEQEYIIQIEKELTEEKEIQQAAIASFDIQINIIKKLYKVIDKFRAKQDQLRGKIIGLTEAFEREKEAKDQALKDFNDCWDKYIEVTAENNKLKETIVDKDICDSCTLEYTPNANGVLVRDCDKCP